MDDDDGLVVDVVLADYDFAPRGAINLDREAIPDDAADDLRLIRVAMLAESLVVEASSSSDEERPRDARETSGSWVE